MEIKFVAQQKVLGLSDCERLCGQQSVEIGELAARAGWCGIPGGRVSVTIGTALNMLVLSIAKRHGGEVQVMAAWLPGLREEALLELGMDISNWSFEGTYDAGQQFWPILYGSRDAVRPRVARLLGCYSNSPTSQLRFFSPSDVELVPACRFEQGQSNRTPRFVINAHDLAQKIQGTCGSPLFTVKTANLP